VLDFSKRAGRRWQGVLLAAIWNGGKDGAIEGRAAQFRYAAPI